MNLDSLMDDKIKECLSALGYDTSDKEAVILSAAAFIRSYDEAVIEKKDDLLLALMREVDRKKMQSIETRAKLRSGIGWGLILFLILGGAFKLRKGAYRKSRRV